MTILVAGCPVLPVSLPPDLPAGPTPPPDAVVVPPGQMHLGINNGTSLSVTLVVNGNVVRQVDPGEAPILTAAPLPARPWNVEVRSPSGRVLVGMTVRNGDRWTRDNADGSSEAKTAGARADLSCGRIDIWSGMQMLGPAPGPGEPGGLPSVAAPAPRARPDGLVSVPDGLVSVPDGTGSHRDIGSGRHPVTAGHPPGPPESESGLFLRPPVTSWPIVTAQ